MRLASASYRFIPALFFLLLVCRAQLAPPPVPEAPPAAPWTDWLGPVGYARIRARLRDQSALARKDSAVVEVEVQNVFLDRFNPHPGNPSQRGLLRYQLDKHPPVATAQTRRRFDHLGAGEHTITIAVIGDDKRPITPRVKLHLEVP